MYYKTETECKFKVVRYFKFTDKDLMDSLIHSTIKQILRVSNKSKYDIVNEIITSISKEEYEEHEGEIDVLVLR
jgi:hypothetical protein